MEQKNSKAIWQLVIVFMGILLLVLAGGIIIILLQGGHVITGREVLHSVAFPLAAFIPTWILLLRKTRPTPKQEKIIRAMLISALILLAANVLVFWLF